MNGVLVLAQGALRAAADDLTRIRAALAESSALELVPPAARDEVSQAVATVWSDYARSTNHLKELALLLHQGIEERLAAAAEKYEAAEQRAVNHLAGHVNPIGVPVDLFFVRWGGVLFDRLQDRLRDLREHL